MDTSKKYIEMCERAGEIQKNHVYTTGDWAYDVTYKGVGVFTQYAKILPEHSGVVAFNYVQKLDESCIDGVSWLPRQDQLQEMVNGNEVTPAYSSTTFRLYHAPAVTPTAITYTDKPQFTTMEQLWLAFVMKERYSKVWSTTKEEWVAQQVE